MRGIAALVIMISLAGGAVFAAPAQTAPAVPAAAAAPPQPIKATLNDGSIIEIDADGSVWAMLADGKHPAPDGTLTLKDSTPFVVKDGKWVQEKD